MDKYRGNGDLRDHLREFCTATLEFAVDETYLMRLFSHSLGGSEMEWFSRLPLAIKSFQELADKFVSQYAYNYEHEVTMMDLFNTKQREE